MNSKRSSSTQANHQSKQQQEFNNMKISLPAETNNDYKYLPPIKPTHQEVSDPKWQELKIEGKNIHNRAYTAIAILDHYLYIYGGYQVSIGIINDFHKMNLTAKHFFWESIPDTAPGPRTKHSFTPYNNKLCLFGGQCAPSLSSNQVWIYQEPNWTLKDWNQTYPPEIDNHSAALYKDKLVIFGGFFGGKIGLHSNYVFCYNFETNQWQKLFPHDEADLYAPAPRDGCGMDILGDKMFVFGGSNGHERFNDMWQFDLIQEKWLFIQLKNAQLPRVRSGLTLNEYNEKLLLFGGIHDITWELDDLHCFKIKQQVWELIDEDSSRRKEVPVSPSKESSPTKSNRRQTKNLRLRGYSNFHKKSTFVKRNTSSKKDLQDQSQEYEGESRMGMTLAQSHQRTLEEKRVRPFNDQNLKKAERITEQEDEYAQNIEKRGFDNHSPTSEAMRNSLIVIGNPKSDLKVKPGRLTEFGKPTFSKFLQPISATQNSIQGKRPCARDGHASARMDDKLLIFGGDRHQMSFNDLYLLDLSQIK